MFKKFDIQFTDVDPEEFMGEQTWNAADRDILFEYEIKKDLVESLIKDKIKFNIKPFNVNFTKIVSPGPPPHTDYYTVALNIYLTAGGKDITKFWKQNENEIGEYLEGPSVFKTDMELLGSFTANKGDVYLLNTGMIHSVSIPKGTEPRYIIRFAWHEKSFDEIAESIIIL